MGGLLSHQEHKQRPNSKLKYNISCINCGKIFTKKNYMQEFNNHEITCKEINNISSNNINSPEISVNDKELIKAIIKEKNKNKSTGKYSETNENSLHTNTDITERDHNVYFNPDNFHTGPQNNITNKKKSNSFLTNKNHSQYISSSNINNRISPIFSSNIESDTFSTNIEQNMHINLNITKPYVKKKFSLSKKIISYFNSNYLKDFPFEEKLKQFKRHIQGLKIDWREGACTLHLDRDDLLNQSMQQFNMIDPYKELKINFKGEVSHDAGGLIREWYTVIFKELQKDSLGK
jgi:hypothetical protein